MTQTFLAHVVEKNAAGDVAGSLQSLAVDALPPGEVLIRVEYSSLNYKDALAATGHAGVVRSFPHVPGIDCAGVVEQTSCSDFQPGDAVLVTGFQLGSGQWGGWSQLVRVSAEWVIPLPEGLTSRQVMAIGTAGFTAATCIEELEKHGVTPASGEIVVTGASGGVGCLAVNMLSQLGYEVAAVSGKPEMHGLLKQLGAGEILSRSEIIDTSNKSMLSARWAGAVDTVGGVTLGTILRSLGRDGCACACGLVGGVEVPVTVYPFLLRGISLIGIDSSGYPAARRASLWRRLSGDCRPSLLDLVTEEISLNEVGDKVVQTLTGQSRGRVVIRIGNEV